MQHPYEKNCYSINTETNNMIFQSAQQLHLHNVPKGYLVLSKNDFGKVKKRVNVGIFNKKTNFRVGEQHSLTFWDNQEGKISEVDTSVALSEPSRYFIFYDLNFMMEDFNENIVIEDKNIAEKVSLILNKQFGQDIGKFLSKFKPETLVIPDEFKILKSIIQINNGRLTVNKQVLINSNPFFLLGILEGYIGDNRYFELQNNINIYNISYILNLLGAQYSIRSLPNHSKQVRFKLPIILKQNSTLSENFFRKYKYIFTQNEEKPVLILKKNIVNLKINTENVSFFELVNSGLVEMIPVKDLIFLEIKDQVMYDLTMSHADATNYSLPGTPLLENSDGDVLGAAAILSLDSASECIRKFSTELKENFLNLATGEVNNWGVKLDSQLGLYSATT